MTGLISLFVIILLSLLINRIASVVLRLTGVSHDVARFQALSAFTGVGFTTAEAEQVVGHPLRRRVLMILMMLGNAGVISAMASLIISFVNVRGFSEGAIQLGVLAVGLGALWSIASSHWVEEWMSRLIERGLRRWTDLKVRDYVALLHLAHEYRVQEVKVEAGDWLADQRLAQLDLGNEGLLVLGIRREDGSYVGAPTGATEVCAGDTILLYGREKLLDEIDVRRAGSAGEQAHQRAVIEQQSILREQAEQEEASALQRESRQSASRQA